MWKARSLVAVGALAVLAAACGTTVGGVASVDTDVVSQLAGTTSSTPSVTSGGTTASKTSRTTGSSRTTSTRTSKPTPPSRPNTSLVPVPTSETAPPTSVPDPTTVVPEPPLACPDGSVAPVGAPYCYPMPAGFTDITETLVGGSSTEYWETAIAPDPAAVYDLIDVTGYHEDLDWSLLSDDLLVAGWQNIYQVGQNDVTQVGDTVVSSYIGHKAVEVTLTRANGEHDRIVTIFDGRSSVSVACQSLEHPDLIGAGCDAVLSTLQIVDSTT